MNKQKLFLIPALSLAASLALAPTGFAADLSNQPSTTQSNQSVAAPAFTPPTYSVGTTTELLELNGRASITIVPTQYATFNVKIFNANGQQVSNMVYSGSSSTTLVKSDSSLVGFHKIAVTSNLVGQSPGTFYVNY